MTETADMARSEPASAIPADFLEAIGTRIGKENLSTDPALLELYSTDFSEIRLGRADAIARPGTSDEVAHILRLAGEKGVSVVVRGGGMSYTLGYAPRDKGSLLIDMARFDTIETINRESRFITVGAGVTWAQIDEALEDTGLALRFRGTMSGIRATVGGGLGNNATGNGIGDISHDLMGLEAVLPDGRIVQTGARAFAPDLPGVKHNSPDLTGLFINDAGVFGVRTKATFRLNRAYSCFASVMFGFDDPEPLVEAMCKAARFDTATDIMSFSAYHHRVFASQPRPRGEEARAMARTIARQAGGGMRGMRRLASLLNPKALSSLAGIPYSLLVNCDAHDAATARRNAREIGRSVRRLGGRPISPALAYGLRARPFVPIATLILGMDGECSIPTNCTVPLERAAEARRGVDEFFRRNRTDMERYGVTHTYLMLMLGNLFGIEPILYWQDAISPLRLEVSDPKTREALSRRSSNPETRAYVLDLRRRLVEEVCRPLNAAHFQLGKYYPLEDALASEANWTVLKDLKGSFDPKGILNPGGLGLA
jgi:D-lactate dehydrogenase (cytochrome)